MILTIGIIYTMVIKISFLCGERVRHKVTMAIALAPASGDSTKATTLRTMKMKHTTVCGNNTSSGCTPFPKRKDDRLTDTAANQFSFIDSIVSKRTVLYSEAF